LSLTEKTTGPAPPSPFSCENVDRAEGPLLICRGEMDISATAALEDCISEAQKSGDPIEIDLEEVTFLDSMGLRSLLSLFNRIEGEPPRVVAASPQVRRVIDLTGTAEVFGLED
jgi:anti-sigma B factor antagonist